jgi:drug/metabolite transporter (DMT)-like permease
MSSTVILVVLLAAAMHAGWNAIVKSGRDKFFEITLVTTGAAIFGAAFIPFLPLPATSSWMFLAASVAIHCVYFSLVAAAYHSGDLSFAYPIMRGTAPLITAVLSIAVFNEPLSPAGWIAIALLSAGVLALTHDARSNGPHQGRSLLFGLGNAAVIVAYTLVDGVGVRLSGNAWSYSAWLFFLNAIPLLVILRMSRGPVFVRSGQRSWRLGLMGGGLTFAAYSLALWAMTVAPVALVAALRETAVVFGVIAASALLKEKFGASRWTASLLVATGAVVLKLV